MSRSTLKWIPAIVVPAVVIAGIVAVPLQAGAAVTLPEKSPQQLLQLVSSSAGTAFSGTVVKTAALGLPSMELSSGLSQSMVDSMSKSAPKGMEEFVPRAASAGAIASALELLSGTTAAKVYADGPKNTRVQLKDRLAERSLVSDGTDVWAYDSQTNAATHAVIPAGTEAAARSRLAELGAAQAIDLTSPARVADRILGEIDPSTTVTVGTAGMVAGRTAYELVLTPKATGTLVASVSVSIDSKTGLPLRVEVLAAGQKDPAFAVGFTSVDFGAQASSLFHFTPPGGATITQVAKPALPNVGIAPKVAKDNLPTVIGGGWDAIVEVPATAIPQELAKSPLVSELSTKVTGGRLLHTALVNVFLTDDGRVFAGSVSLERLQAAATAQ